MTTTGITNAIGTDSTATHSLVTVDSSQSGVATITLNRPSKRNALSLELLDQYSNALEETMHQPDVKVVVTAGAGPSFCAGMDLHQLRDWAQAWDLDALPWSDLGPLERAMSLLRRHNAITVARIHGYCAGGGIALLVAHDLAVCADDTKFILPETQRGSFGALAATALQHAIPPKKALDVQLCGRELSGTEASALGLVSRAVPVDALDSEVDGMVATLKSRDAVPLHHSKMAYYLTENEPLEKALHLDLLVRTRQDRARNSFTDVDGFLQDRKSSSSES